MSKCKRCGLEFGYPKIRANESEFNQCYYCNLTDRLKKQYENKDIFDLVKQIKKEGKARQYDCLIGISGGIDSSILLYMAMKVFQLKVLAIHYDNWYNTPEAEANIRLLQNNLNFDFIRFTLNKQTVDEANAKLIDAGVPDSDIHNDMTMAYLMNKTAIDYKIKYILNGHNYRTEGTSPIEWTYMDARYLQSITGQKWFKNTIWFQLLTSWKGVKQVRPFYYLFESEIENVKKYLFDIGFNKYSCKHGENYHTLFVGAYYLPKRFGIDKDSTTYKAAMKRNRIKSLKQEPVSLQYIFNNIPFSKEQIDSLPFITPAQVETNRNKYDSYRSTFKKYRLFFFILTKLLFFPELFYKKYCK